jgi:hypothetical protein
MASSTEKHLEDQRSHGSFKATLRQAAAKLCNTMDSAEYKHCCASCWVYLLQVRFRFVRGNALESKL